jgi:hypothetical protein
MEQCSFGFVPPRAIRVITTIIPSANMHISVALKIVLIYFYTIRWTSILIVFCRRSACYGLANALITCMKKYMWLRELVTAKILG